MQDGAPGMSTAIAYLLGLLIAAFCLWHVQRSLRGGLGCISHKKHSAVIYAAPNEGSIIVAGSKHALKAI